LYRQFALCASFCPLFDFFLFFNLNQALVGEGLAPQKASRKMSLVIGARRHLEWGHEKFILETINSHPALVSILFKHVLNNYFSNVWLW
jgi:hypothetical protein